MIIFTNYLKRIVKKPLNIIFLIIVPVVSIVAAFAMTGGGRPIVVGVADNDSTPFTKSLIENLGTKCTVIKLDEDNIRYKLINLLADYAISIDKGFTEGIISGSDAKLKAYSIQGANTFMPAKLNIESYISSAKNIAHAAGGNSERFYKGLEAYKNSIFKSNSQMLDDSARKMSNTVMTGMAFLAMSMLYLSTFAPMIMIQDKKSKTFFRVFAAPLTVRTYMLQSGLSFLALSVIQVVSILLIMTGVFKLSFNVPLIYMFAVLGAFSLVCVSFGLAICSISKDERQLSTLSSLLIVPICMLGGCFWPREIMPAVLQTISEFVPTTWVLRGVEKLMATGSIAAVGKELLILLLFSLVFFLLGSQRKADISA